MSKDTLHLKYRPDIDGLRAIAVLSVVLYHSFPNLLPGGFVGVDIFFVISGFLISTILFQNIDHKTFSIGDFYSRRIRRIFPSLILILFFVLGFGWLCLFPDELQQLGKHAAASAGFIQNFILWKESGYFDNISETKPLLHIWSLGIEEQFYLIWPLLLWGGAKLSEFFGLRRKRIFLFLTTILIFTISFILNLALIKIDPVKTFYLPQYRFFELALGSILSWLILYQPELPNLFTSWSLKKFLPSWFAEERIKTAIGLVCLLILLLIFHQYNKEALFPGKKVLLPILATALMIWVGPSSLLNKKILSHKILVWFGLISFPLYLWHWPILSFMRIIYGEIPPYEFRLAAIAVSIILSWFTVRTIEKPFRFGSACIGLKVSILCLLISCAGTLGYYFLVCPSEQFSTDSQKETEQIVANAVENCKKHFPKWVDTKGLGTDQWCSLQTEKPTIALIGDSHSGHLYYGLVNKLKYTKESVANFPASCAAPLINVTTGLSPSIPYRSNNGRLMNLGFEYIGKAPLIHTVYLAHNPDCSFGNAIDLENPNETNDFAVLQSGLMRTLKFLTSKNKNIVIVLDTPLFPFLPGRCKPRGLILDSFRPSCDVEIRSVSRDRYKNLINDVVTSKFPNVKVVDLTKLFCHSGKCNPVQNGRLLLLNNDGEHLNRDGSMFVSEYLSKALN